MIQNIFVYGTLKTGYGNNRILQDGNAIFVSEYKLLGFKLYNCGFPVAYPEKDSQIEGEIWNIGNGKFKETLQRLDWLENEGSMYNRVYIKEENLSLYVGTANFISSLRKECSYTEESGIKTYEWSR